MGLAEEQKGNTESAIAEYRSALKSNPSYAQVHNRLGMLLLKRRAMEEAQKEFRSAVEIDPKNATGHYNLGTLMAVRGQMDRAAAPLRPCRVLFDKTLAGDDNTRRRIELRQEELVWRGCTLW